MKFGTGFNEAAANVPRMIKLQQEATRGMSQRFNEAAANVPRMILPDGLVRRDALRFNEAAANVPRMIAGLVGVAAHMVEASMRPRRTCRG